MYFRAVGFDLVRPDTLEEAIAAYESAEDSAYLAGGTALLSSRYARNGDFPSLLVSLANLEGNSGVTTENGATRIGALTPLTQLETSETIAQSFPTLYEAVSSSGSWQVRTRATIGGNIANASPTADLGPSLLALGARVSYSDHKGQHEIELGKFWKGPGELNVQPSAVITAVELPTPSPATGSAYQRLSLRPAMDTAMAGVSVSVSLDEAGRITESRIVLGGVVGIPTRVVKAEKALAGASADDPHPLEEALRLVEAEAKNPKLLRTRSSPTIAGYLRRSKPGGKDKAGEYRVRVIPVLASRAIQTALERANARQHGART